MIPKDNTPETNLPPSDEFPTSIPKAIQEIRERKAGKFPLPADELEIISSESAELPSIITNPLDQPVINNQRDTPQTQGLDVVTPINEPTVRNPVVTQPIPDLPSNKEIKQEHAKEWDAKKNYATKSLGEKEPGAAPANPGVTTMTPKEEKEALKMSVETALYVYSKAKSFIGELFVTSPTSMRSMERVKKIKLDWAVDYDEATNEPFTFRQFIAETNKRIIKACETSEEFKNKIRPVLEAEFAKRGWILTYQQNLMFMIGQDLFETAQKLFMMNKNMNDAIKRIQSEVKEFQAEGGISNRQMYNLQQNKVYVPFRTPVANSDPAFETNGTPSTQWPTSQISEAQPQKTEVATTPATSSNETIQEAKNEQPPVVEKKVVFSPPPAD